MHMRAFASLFKLPAYWSLDAVVLDRDINQRSKSKKVTAHLSIFPILYCSMRQCGVFNASFRDKVLVSSSNCMQLV